MSEEKMNTSDAQEQVVLALRRLALYHASMVRVLREKLGDDEGRELAREIIDHYGRKIGLSAREKSNRKGLSPTPQNYSEDLPLLGFDTEKVRDDPFTIRISNCPLAEVWKELEAQDDGALYCRVDQAKYNAYNPEFSCSHKVHCLRDGKGYCDVTVEPKTD